MDATPLKGSMQGPFSFPAQHGRAREADVLPGQVREIVEPPDAMRGENPRRSIVEPQGLLKLAGRESGVMRPWRGGVVHEVLMGAG